MFPFDLDDEEDVLISDETTSEPSDYEIDFSTGKLTGKIITGIDAIKQWIRLVLGTERYYFTQFSWQYGSELSSLIGHNYTQEYVQNEVKRMIGDALKTSEDIESISNISCELNRDQLVASFTVNTIYGSEEVQISV